MLTEHAFDLARLYSLSPQLYLVVVPAEKFEYALGSPANDLNGA